MRQFAHNSTRRAFTLIELMVAIGILLVLGVMIISFLRGALTMTRTGTARGQQYETAQTVMRQAEDDFSQVLGMPANPDGQVDDPAFLIMQDPFGRQVIAFTRAWGEEQSSLAGYDAGRGSTDQGYNQDFTGRNVNTTMRASHGNLEVVYMIEPVSGSTKLYRAERSPPDVNNGLITQVAQWCVDTPAAGADDPGPMAELQNPNGKYAIGGEALWDQFELVADNVLAFGVECWDDWDHTTTWYAGSNGPVTNWSLLDRINAGKYALPRALRLTLIVAAEEPLRAETELTNSVATGDTSVYVDDTDRFPDLGSPSAFLRIDGELIAYGSRFGRTFGSCVRGALGSRAQKHAAGATVLAGEAFQRVIQLPVTR